MKFHRLQLQNINSLYGDDHVVDFDADLDSAPLFLIMGPTGSGKSTLLDAICLTLFGETPRQREKPKDVARAIMSRTKGEASAKLVFSRRDPQLGRRVRYRARWYCNRAYKKASGNIQEPRRSLDVLEDGEWKTLVSDNTIKKEYRPHFQKARAGMELDDFLRSVLLAQGEFTAFLDADEQTKADILEKLTSTDQYIQIGARAKKRWQKARDEAQKIEADIEKLDILSDDEFTEAQKELEQLEENVEKLDKKREKLRQKVQWLKRLDELEENLKEKNEALKKSTQAKDKRADDYERLQRAQQARPLANTLNQRDELDEELEKISEALKELKTQIEDAEESRDDKNSALKQAETQLEKAQKQREALSDEIKQARELRSELKNARKNLEEAEKERKNEAKKLKTLRDKLAEAEKKTESATEDADAASQTLKDLADHEGLAEQLAGLQARTTSLIDSRRQLKKQVDQQTKLVQKRNEKREEREQLAEQIEEKKEKLEPLKTKCDEAKKALDEQLGDAQDVAGRRRELREKREKAQRQRSGIAPLLERLQRYKSLSSDVEELEETTDSLQDEIEELTTRRETLDEKLEYAAEKIALKSEKVDVRKLPIELAKQREQLNADEHCPLCGSTEHPYRENPPEIDELETALRDAKDELETAQKDEAELQDKERKLDKEQTKKQERLQSKTSSHDKALEKLQSLRDTITDQLQRIDVDGGLDRLDALQSTIEEKKTSLQDTCKNLEQSLQGLETLEKQLRSSTDALRAHESELNTKRERLATLKETLEDLNKRIGNNDDEIDTQKETIAQENRQLQDDFGAVGIDVSDGGEDALKKALATAKEKKKARAKAENALQEAQKTLREKSATVEKLEGQLPDQKQRLEDAEEKYGELKKKVQKLDKQVAQLLDGRAPDTVEKGLEKSISEARKVVEQAQKTFNEAKSECKKLEERRKQKKATYEKSDKKRKELQQRLSEDLKSTRFDTEQQLRRAVMEPKQLEKLKKELGDLDEKVSRAEATVESVDEDLQEHRGDRPEAFTEEGGESDPDLEALDGRLKEVKEAYQAKRDRKVKKETELEQERDKRKRQTELTDKLSEADDTRQLWKRLKDLIGSNDGEKFKNFAQALNLENIVHHANRHLDKLNDRYRLAVVHDEMGHPKLDFEILDEYHNNRPRSLSTLSGGEEFLVSLSLALALADFRQVQMPVETLLLDEGFGTLDQESLGEAVKALQGLHSRESRQVGVISHVERLQDRIEHRIVLNKLGGGRSEIEIDVP